jgi:protein involved in polysaccharide export with SLBB domain
MKKSILLLLLFLSLSTLSALEVETTTPKEESQLLTHTKHYFGEQLFRGHFTTPSQFRQNPNYLLKVGDIVNVKIWGAYTFEGDLTIDDKGNIFIPQVGTIYLLNTSNKSLQSTLEASLKKVFNDKVYLYANVKFYQPLSIFVSGGVKDIGLYNGFASDSVLQFLDKAHGIIPGVGSYRHIQILRHKRVVKNIDLYNFLLHGSLSPFRFQQGDVILVKPMRSFVEVEGDVGRPYIFELKGSHTSVKSILRYVLPKPSVNQFIHTKLQGNQELSRAYPLKEASRITLHKGEKVTFVSNHYLSSASITIEGEHQGLRHLSVPKGTSLYDVLSHVKFSPLSNIQSTQLFRKSVATMQKELLLTKLKDLEARALTTDSSTSAEATIREKESARILTFIERAKKITPRGQIVLSKTQDLRQTILEDGDTIYIPRKSNLVIVQGEVGIPNALSYKANQSLESYIEACGGFTQRADKSNVLLVKANGQVIAQDTTSFSFSSPKVEAGDSILVLSKTDTKDLLLTKDITQILYQIAVGAAVVINAF